MNERNVPEVRFRGFSGEWESKELEELAFFSKGNGFSKSDLVNEGFPIILYGRLYTKYETFISEVDTFIANNSNAIISKGNEVIVPASGETAEDISRASVVGGKGIVLGGDLNIIYPNKDLFPIFLALSISNGTQQREMMKRAQGKSVVHLHNSDLSEIKLKYPIKVEQTKIGEFFKNLDNLISQNQKKYNKLVNMKKACLDKMFPKDGADTPEVRFKGFGGEWEWRELGIEATEIVAGGDVDKGKLLKNGKYPVLANALSNDGYLGFYENDFRIAAPAVTVTGRGDVGHARARKVNFTPVVRLLSIKSCHCVDFLENAINIHVVTVESTGVPQLTVPQLTKYKICFPNDIEEEEKVGNFFQTLDNLITLQKTKLEKLKNIKKACLDKMFI